MCNFVLFFCEYKRCGDTSFSYASTEKATSVLCNQ